jgi:hypothetical protein
MTKQIKVLVQLQKEHKVKRFRTEIKKRRGMIA